MSEELKACRDAFERRFSPDEQGLKRDQNGNYTFMTAHVAWGNFQLGWRAGGDDDRQGVDASLIEAVERLRTEEKIGVDKPIEHYKRGRNDAVEDVVALVRQHQARIAMPVEEEDAICKACATYACASASGGVDPDAMREAIACYKCLRPIPDTWGEMGDGWVAIDISDLQKLRDSALQACDYHRANSEFRSKHSDGVLGEAELVLSIQRNQAAQYAAMIIDFITRNGTPLTEFIHPGRSPQPAPQKPDTGRVSEGVLSLRAAAALTRKYLEFVGEHTIGNREITELREVHYQIQNAISALASTASADGGEE